jgi:hypothetical protein
MDDAAVPTTRQPAAVMLSGHARVLTGWSPPCDVAGSKLSPPATRLQPVCSSTVPFDSMPLAAVRTTAAKVASS